MRASFEGTIKLSKKNNLQCLNLGADYCAEHEWGIKELLRKLGVSGDGFGLERRKVSTGENVLWYEGKKYTGLYSKLWSTFNSDSDKVNFDEWLHSYRVAYEKKPYKFWAGWNGRDFYVIAESSDKKTIKLLRVLFDAFQKNDVAVWLGGGGIFQNSGLTFGVVSAMPKEIFESWEAKDKERLEKEEWLKSTGIEDYLQKHDKKWFFLGNPQDMHGKRKLWLNPYEQRIYNAGWYTIEELKQWAKDKGPVIKKD